MTINCFINYTSNIEFNQNNWSNNLLLNDQFYCYQIEQDTGVIINCYRSTLASCEVPRNVWGPSRFGGGWVQRHSGFRHQDRGGHRAAQQEQLAAHHCASGGGGLASMAPTIRGPGYVGGVIARGAQGQFPDRFCLKTKCRFTTHATKSYLPRMVTRGYYVKQNDTHGYSELCCKTSIRGCNKLLLCITTVKLVHKIMRVF